MNDPVPLVPNRASTTPRSCRRLLVLGINYPPERIGIAVYTGGLAEAFARAGWDVSVVTAHPYYPDWKIPDGVSAWSWRSTREGGVAILRCPLYVPSSPTGVRRMLHHLSFAVSAVVPMLWRAVRKRPDLVLVVAPSLVSAPAGWLAARLARTRNWLHIQDFEVEAAFATGLLDPQSRAARLARWFERTVLRSFDNVSTISLEMLRRLPAMGVPEHRTYLLRNWADIDAVTPLAGPSGYRDRWGITAPHIALYSGNIANKQGIEIVVDAARQLAHRHDLLFMVCGQGPSRDALEASASDLPNIRFFDLQPVEMLSDLLGLATVHLLPQRAEAADLVLPSKLTNMLASGRPVIATADPDTGLARELVGCGIAVPPGDAVALAKAIESVIDDPARSLDMARAARARAEETWNRKRITRSFIDEVEHRLRALRTRGVR